MNNKSSAVLRFVAGFYLIYLAYNIISAVMRGETEGNSTLLLIAGVAFVILGVLIIALGYREMKKANLETEEEEQSEAVEEAEESAEVIETTEETEIDVEKETADE